MGEFESINKAGLLVQVAEVADKFDDLGLFSEFFTSFGLNCNRHVTRVYPNETNVRHLFLSHMSYYLIFEVFQK